MKDLILSWNYKKHASLVTSFYVLLLLIGNLTIGTFKKLKKTKGKPLSKKIKKLSSREKQFNLVLLGCYAIDMTITYQLIKLLKNRI